MPAQNSNSSKIKSSPRYREVAKILQNEIETGIYAVGALMPTEQVLCNRFGVSRFTVREALRRLIDNGMVTRRQGSGTIVISKEPSIKFVQKIESIQELLHYSSDTILKVKNITTLIADKKLADLTGYEPNESLEQIEGIRYFDKKSPICWTDIYVRPEHRDIASQIGKDQTPVFLLFQRNFGIVAHTINMDLHGGIIREEKAQALGVEPGSPTLVIVRCYRDKNGQIFEVSISEHPAGRFNFSIDLMRGKTSAGGVTGPTKWQELDTIG